MGLRHWQRTALAVVAILVVGAGARAMWNFYLRGPTTPVEVASKDRMNFPLPEKPSIAVLPFVNMSGDPEQEYFSDGITEDLITDISKLSGVFVIARNSTFIYKGRPVKIQQVAEELGVRYVLEGSVRKAEQQVRITAQLVDALTGHHLWAERYDRDLTNVFALQDEIVQKIVDALAVELTEGERGRVVRKATDNPEAYDYFLRGQGYFWRTTKEANTRARRMFEKATELDPEYAEPYAALGFTYFQQWALLWSQDPQTLKQAFEFGQQAIALNDSLSMAHNILGRVYLWQKQHEQAIAEGERAIALAPNDAEGYAALGDILAWSGRPEEAIKLVKKAMRLNPRYPFIYLWTLGHAYYLTEQYEEAIAALKRLLTHNPDFMPAHAYLASMYGEFGRKDKAQAEGAEVRRISPEISLESLQKRLPYKAEATLERSLNGFRKAGLK